MERFFALAVAVAASSCGASGSAPDDGGVDAPVDAPTNADAGTDGSTGLDPFCQSVLEEVLAAADTTGAPGGGFAVVLEGDLVCIVPHGIERADVPVTADTLFRWGWTSTTVTALTALELAAAGEIGLDDTMPATLLEGIEPAAWAAEIRIRDLLWSSSGLPQGSFYLEPCTAEGPDAAEFLRTFDAGDRVMWARPGRIGHGSNAAKVMLGLALEHATGRPLAELVEEQVYQPLGMEDSHFGWSEELASRGLVAYEPSGAPGAPSLDSELKQACPAADARFGVTTSLRDGSRLLQVLARDGLDTDGTRLLSESTMSAMLEQGPRSPHYGPWIHFGPGGGVGDDPAPFYFNAGYGTGSGSEIVFSPEMGLGVFTLSNLNWWEAQRVATSAVLSEHGFRAPNREDSLPEPWEPTPEMLNEYAGKWVAPIAGIEGTLEVVDGVLYAHAGSYPARPIQPTAPDLFRQGLANRAWRVSFWRTDGVLDLGLFDGPHEPDFPYAFYPQGSVPPEISALVETP